MIFSRKNKQNNSGFDDDRRLGHYGPTIITAEVAIEGKVITGGELQVDGTIHGNVRAASIVVDVQGAIHGEVVAEEIVVRGRIIGPLRGIHVHIFSGGHVEGDIVHETISIENGAFIEGNIRRADDPIDIARAVGIAEEEGEDLAFPVLFEEEPRREPAPREGPAQKDDEEEDDDKGFILSPGLVRTPDSNAAE